MKMSLSLGRSLQVPGRWRPVRLARPRLAVLPGVVGLLGLAGCGGLEPVATHEATTDPAQLYMMLTLEQRAINLAPAAPYNTVQLVATPRDGRGAVMAGLPTPTFRLATPGDTTVLQVTPEGQVTALAPASQIAVIAELVGPGPVRHTDMALVTVTPAPPTLLDRLSIEPASSASALFPMGAGQYFMVTFGFIPKPRLIPQALDAVGQPIAGLVIEYASLDPARATVDRWTGEVNPVRPGPVRLVARTTAYGVAKTDTARYTVSWPTEESINIVPGAGPGGAGIFEPAEIKIYPNGFVFWNNQVGESVDVTFDDPAKVALPVTPVCDFVGSAYPDFCGAGNMLIPPYDPNGDPFLTARLRQFPVPGVYPYRSTRTGATGRIIVTDELPAN